MNLEKSLCCSPAFGACFPFHSSSRLSFGSNLFKEFLILFHPKHLSLDGQLKEATGKWFGEVINPCEKQSQVLVVDPKGWIPYLWHGVLGVHPFLRLTAGFGWDVQTGHGRGKRRVGVFAFTGSSPQEFYFTKPRVLLSIGRIRGIDLPNIGSDCQAALVRTPFYKDGLQNFLKNTFERIMFPS